MALAIWQHNSNGIRSNLPEIKHLIEKSSNKPEFICIQETFLKPHNSIKLDNYTAVRRDRLNRAKGGVATFIRDNIQYEQIILDIENLEFITIKFKIGNEFYHLSNIYDSNANINTDSYEPFFKLKNSIIVGDFNAHHSMWGHTKDDQKGRALVHLIDKYDFILMNDKSFTRMDNRSSSVLDLALMSKEIAINFHWENTFNSLNSDHNLIKITSNLQSDSIYDKDNPKWNFKKANWPLFTQICEKEITEEIIVDNPERMYNKLEDIIITAAKKCIPLKKSSRFKKKIWWNEQCTQALKLRNKARNKAKHTKDLHDFIEYKKQKAIARRIIKENQKMYWENFCNNLNTDCKANRLWKIIRGMNGKTKRNTIPVIHYKDNSHFDDSGKANILNSHFAQISSNENYSKEFLLKKDKLIEQYSDILNDEKQFDISYNENFTLDELKKAIRSKSDTSPGKDRICYIFFRKMSEGTLNIIVKIINKMWEKSFIPESWKSTIIIPILKDGKSPHETTSYRPISLTSNFCKLFETMLNQRLLWFLETNNKLRNNQSGFRRYHSTLDHLITISDTINKALCNKQSTLALFLDITKAYDMVNTEGLLIKLHQIGIQGRAFLWIKEFLCNRCHQVQVNTSLSSFKKSENGVPQGSVISPLLFNIMINDIPLPANSNNSLFADDIAIWEPRKNVKQANKNLQKHLDKIIEWSAQWGIQFSAPKTKLIEFGKGHNNRKFKPFVTINNETIKCDDSVKFLGMHFDKGFTWKMHIDSVIKKCNKYLNIMRVISGQSWGIGKKNLLKVYRATIKALISYGAPTYINAKQEQLKRLDTIQFKALKIANGSIRSTPNNSLLANSAEPPLHIQRIQQTLKYFVNAKTHNIPTQKLLEESWHEYYSKRPFTSVKHIIENYEREFITPVCKLPLEPKPPWHLWKCKVITELADKCSKNNPQQSRALALDLINQYPYHLQIYTDGSKKQDKTSYAFYVHEFKYHKSNRLPNNTSIFTAEAVAISNVLHIIEDTRVERSLTLSDSLSVLKAIQANVK